jgi:hypothetical protein
MAKCGGRPKVESSITLDLWHLTGAGLVPGITRLIICNGRGRTVGNPVCQIAKLRSTRMSVPCTWLASPVSILWEACSRGGADDPLGHHHSTLWERRWWFVCLSTNRLVMKLHLPYGARVFASRQVYRRVMPCGEKALRNDRAGELARPGSGLVEVQI